MMFTGLIQEIGTIQKAERYGGYLRLKISYDADGGGELRPGDSMAVNGVCLTANVVANRYFSADLSSETQRSTTLGRARIGEKVNLERPVAAADPLGGHIVLGHVDGTGKIRRSLLTAGGLEIFIDATPAITGYLVEKGSVTVDGISLTATGIENDSFKVFIIPETRERTTLGGKRAGGEVNLEVDYLAKLIKKFLNRPGESKTSLYPNYRTED